MALLGSLTPSEIDDFLQTLNSPLFEPRCPSFPATPALFFGPGQAQQQQQQQQSQHEQQAQNATDIGMDAPSFAAFFSGPDMDTFERALQSDRLAYQRLQHQRQQLLLKQRLSSSLQDFGAGVGVGVGVGVPDIQDPCFFFEPLPAAVLEAPAAKTMAPVAPHQRLGGRASMLMMDDLESEFGVQEEAADIVYHPGSVVGASSGASSGAGAGAGADAAAVVGDGHGASPAPSPIEITYSPTETSAPAPAPAPAEQEEHEDEDSTYEDMEDDEEEDEDGEEDEDEEDEEDAEYGAAPAKRKPSSRAPRPSASASASASGSRRGHQHNTRRAAVPPAAAAAEGAAGGDSAQGALLAVAAPSASKTVAFDMQNGKRIAVPVSMMEKKAKLFFQYFEKTFHPSKADMTAMKMLRRKHQLRKSSQKGRREQKIRNESMQAELERLTTSTAADVLHIVRACVSRHVPAAARAGLMADVSAALQDHFRTADSA